MLTYERKCNRCVQPASPPVRNCSLTKEPFNAVSEPWSIGLGTDFEDGQVPSIISNADNDLACAVCPAAPLARYLDSVPGQLGSSTSIFGAQSFDVSDSYAH